MGVVRPCHAIKLLPKESFPLPWWPVNSVTLPTTKSELIVMHRRLINKIHKLSSRYTERGCACTQRRGENFLRKNLLRSKCDGKERVLSLK